MVRWPRWFWGGRMRNRFTGWSEPVNRSLLAGVPDVLSFRRLRPPHCRRRSRGPLRDRPGVRTSPV